MAAVLRRTLGFAVLACLAACGALADQPPAPASKRASMFCYCECQRREHKRQCTKMCELPKYESRAWAASCHKRPPAAPLKSPDSRPHPPKHSGVETAHH